MQFIFFHSHKFFTQVNVVKDPISHFHSSLQFVSNKCIQIYVKFLRNSNNIIGQAIKFRELTENVLIIK